MSEATDTPEPIRRKRGRPSLVAVAERDAEGQMLVGIEEIAAFVRTLAAHPENITDARVAGWLGRGHIPAGKTGALWTAWKPKLRAHFSGDSEMAQVAQ